MQKIHELYNSYELHKLSNDEFRERIQTEVNVAPTKEFNSIISKASEDGKNFKNIINSLDVYEKKPSPVLNYKLDQNKFYPRYKHLPGI